MGLFISILHLIIQSLQLQIPPETRFPGHLQEVLGLRAHVKEHRSLLKQQQKRLLLVQWIKA